MDLISASKTLDFHKIYEIGNAFKRGVLHFDPVTEIESPEKLLRGELRPHTPISFRRESGSKPQDLMGTTYVAILLVSEQFITTLLEEKITGWSTYPVRLHVTEGTKELSSYSGLSVTGRAGPIDQSKSRIELLPPPVPGGRAMYAEIGMYFPPDSWDRRDMFIPDGTLSICVTERVKQAVEKRRLSNISFTPLSDRQGEIYFELPSGK